MRQSTFVVATLVLGSLGGCGTDTGGSGDPPLFPIDYEATYQEVRDCRFSLDHDLVRIRVLASPDALTAYNGRVAPFPTGSVVLKEQYFDSDTTCAGPVVEYTVMQKLDVGASPETLGWSWQKVSGDHTTVKTDIKRCTQCHTGCGQAPEGYGGTCAMP